MGRGATLKIIWMALLFNSGKTQRRDKQKHVVFQNFDNVNKELFTEFWIHEQKKWLSLSGKIAVFYQLFLDQEIVDLLFFF